MKYIYFYLYLYIKKEVVKCVLIKIMRYMRTVCKKCVQNKKKCNLNFHISVQ